MKPDMTSSEYVLDQGGWLDHDPENCCNHWNLAKEELRQSTHSRPDGYCLINQPRESDGGGTDVLYQNTFVYKVLLSMNLRTLQAMRTEFTAAADRKFSAYTFYHPPPTVNTLVPFMTFMTSSRPYYR